VITSVRVVVLISRGPVDDALRDQLGVDLEIARGDARLQVRDLLRVHGRVAAAGQAARLRRDADLGVLGVARGGGHRGRPAHGSRLAHLVDGHALVSVEDWVTAYALHRDSPLGDDTGATLPSFVWTAGFSEA